MYFSKQISFKISFQFNASYLLENATVHVYATRLVAVITCLPSDFFFFLESSADLCDDFSELRSG